MNLVKVKFVETGFLSVKQQTLPGLGDGNKVPFRREHGALNIDLTMAIDMAHAGLAHTYKRNKLQVLVVNAKNNREEIAFEEEGQSETNPDEVMDEAAPDTPTMNGTATQIDKSPLDNAQSINPSVPIITEMTRSKDDLFTK